MSHLGCGKYTAEDKPSVGRVDVEGDPDGGNTQWPSEASCCLLVVLPYPGRSGGGAGGGDGVPSHVATCFSLRTIIAGEQPSPVPSRQVFKTPALYPSPQNSLTHCLPIKSECSA